MAADKHAIQVVEPTLDGYSGHCHSLVSSLCRALAGRPVDLWSARGARDLAFGVHVSNHAVFSRRLRLPQALLLYRRLLRGEAPIVVTTARRSDLILLDLAAPGRIPTGRAFLYVHWLRESPSKMRSLARLARRQPNLTLFGTTASVVDALSRSGFPDVHLLPYPPPLPSGNGEMPFRRLLYAGAARQDKGFSLVADLAERLARDGSGTRLAVQVSADHYGKYDARTLADIERMRATGYVGLELIPETLDPAEYARLFPGGICLQPYDAQEFRDRISGVTLDALTHGCPVVVTAGTWSARLVAASGAGVELHEMTAAGLLEAAAVIEKDYASFSVRARAAGQELNRKSWDPLLVRLPAA